MKPSPQRLAGAAGMLALVAALLLALPWLAARITSAHLSDEAARELALLRSGEPLWSWTFRRPADLVAGRAFGKATVEPVPGGLRVASLDGTPFELGLPVARFVDPAHWPLLVLDRENAAPGTAGVIWRNAGNAACMSSDEPLPAGNGPLRIDLRGRHWRPVDSGGDCTLPASAWMLRLRLALPPGQAIVLRGASLRNAGPVPPPDLGIGASGPPSEILATDQPVPLLRLPRGTSAERQLALRDAAQAAHPAAIVLPDGVGPTMPSSAGPGMTGWALAAGYLLAVLALAVRRPASRIGDTLEIIAIAAGPLWLVAGLQWDAHTPTPALLASAAALLYAAQAAWRARPADWRWLGDGRSWCLPLLLVPVALLLCRLFGHAYAPVRPAHALAYLAWAALQQWLILATIQRRLETTLPTQGLAVVGAALLFALLHTPNGLLMQLCFLAELWWGWCFRRTRVLLPIVIAHAGCALLVEAGLAGGALRSLEVSARFFL